MKKRYTFIICVVVVAVIFGIFYYLQERDNKKDSLRVDENSVNSYEERTKNGVKYSYNGNLRTMLLLGIDGSIGEPLNGQSDFMALMIFDSETNEFNCLMIPRDTMTQVNVCDVNGGFMTSSINHINTAYAYGGGTNYYRGMNALEATSMLLYDVPLRNFLAMPLDIMRDLVRIMGETDIVLEDDSLSYIDEKYVKGYTYHIDEESVELFLRSRDTGEDFSAGNRTDRQIVYLKYLMSKFKEIQEGKLKLSFSDLDSILAKCESNLTNSELNSYYNLMLKAQMNDDAFITIPGSYKMADYDEFHYDVNKLEDVVLDLFYIKN